MQSISRLMNDLVPRHQLDSALLVRQVLSAYYEHEDLINIGAYRKGANKLVDAAIDLLDDVNTFLKQRVDERVSLQQNADALIALAKKIAARMMAAPAATFNK
ncbi:MAG: hypothetical protein QM811_10675 [Pirellulales bacterium]